MMPLLRFRLLANLTVFGALLVGAREAKGAVVGGPTTTFTTSTTHHTTTTASTVDQRGANGQNVIISGGDAVSISWTLGRSLQDPKVQAALQAALRVLNAAKPPFSFGSSAGSSSTTSVLDHTTTAVTQTTWLGPGTIMVGTDQSQPFFVATGTTNINTDTHTESFVNQITTLTGGARLRLDLDAVFSALDSGLPLALSQRESLLNAHSGGIGDVNDRIFRAWLGLNETGAPQGDGEVGDTMRLFGSVNAGWLSRNDGTLSAGLRDTREAGSVGAEWKLRPHFRVGVAATYVHSDTDFSAGLGSQHIDGAALSAYASWRSNGSFLPAPTGKDGKGVRKPAGYCYADLLYSAGFFSDTTERNTLLGSTARSTADDWSQLVALNVGHVFQINDRFATGPYASLTYVHGHLDGTSEHGGGSANLSYGAQDYDSLVSSVGWQANWKLRTSWGALTPLIHAGWERENLKDAGAVSATLVQSPFGYVSGGSVTRFGSFSTGSRRENARYDAFAIGASLTADIGERWTLALSATERTDFGQRNDFSISASARWRY